MPALNAFAAHPEIRDALATVGETLRQVTVEVGNGARSHGSGVIWSDDGLIITNAHVVSDSEPTVELWNGRTLPGRIIRHDPARDLAALRIAAHGLPAAVPADPQQLKPGALVLAMGHPFGVRGALSLGVLHSGSQQGRGARARWLRADLRLAPGNSGGPLADVGGRVLGLNTMIVNGLAYAIPSTAITRFMSAEGDRAVLGVVVRPVALRGRRGGVGFLVLDVAQGSGAAEAGLGIGDVLTAIAGVPFSDPAALAAALEEAQPGDRLQVELVRGFERITREIALGRVPARPRAA
ncbi:MAG TPA: trypsin-like peptidase domain-containing protein [Gemmatimonadales bacterium]|nr:trypsin-like peptidase domain-containing protein [Gemmatimonadales bacterium]